MKKMLLIAFMIGLASCGTTAPRPPVVPECDLIATASTDQYLRCKWTSGGEAWRIPINQLYMHPTRYICTTDQGFADAWAYGKELERWINNNCK